MPILNITYNGCSADVPIDVDGAESDQALKRLAVEVLRSGDVAGFNLASLADDVFEHFVIDRVQGGTRMYLRPKVAFGACSG